MLKISQRPHLLKPVTRIAAGGKAFAIREIIVSGRAAEE